MKNLIFVGAQGSGKGTQAKLLANKHNFLIFETGKALREIAKQDSKLGREVREITTRGDLVPNDVVMNIVQDFVSHNADKNIIFDGIPRSYEQMQSLDKLLEKNNLKYSVIFIDVPLAECLIRLEKRAMIEKRIDDNPESIKKRLDNFEKLTKPLLEIWKKRKQLIRINGFNTPENVDKEIREKLYE